MSDDFKAKLWNYIMSNENGFTNIRDTEHINYLINKHTLLVVNDHKVLLCKFQGKYYVYITKPISQTSLRDIAYWDWKPYNSVKAARADLENIQLKFLAKLI